jgi:hypothetical protein
MDDELYAEWQKRQPSHEFLAGIPAFRDQNLKRKPARELVQAGTARPRLPLPQFLAAMRWLECRHRTWRLRFLRHFFSGLWKLTTAAAIPYYTGQYGKTPQGFGFVTIGANVDEFHKAATETAAKSTHCWRKRTPVSRPSAAKCLTRSAKPDLDCLRPLGIDLADGGHRHRHCHLDGQPSYPPHHRHDLRNPRLPAR